MAAACYNLRVSRIEVEVFAWQTRHDLGGGAPGRASGRRAARAGGGDQGAAARKRGPCISVERRQILVPTVLAKAEPTNFRSGGIFVPGRLMTFMIAIKKNGQNIFGVFFKEVCGKIF